MNLTPSQLAAIQTDAREALIIAGAGSGKTAVLVRRVQYLIERGADPNSLMVLTFTRKAAREMRQRLHALIGSDVNILIGTFHSVALRILQVYGDAIGYDGPRITILDPDDADMLLKQVAGELGYWRSGKWKYGLSDKRIHRWREDLYCGRETEFEDAADRQRCDDLLREYQSRLFEWNALDFGQILLQCRRLLREKPDVLAKYHERIKHVLVDESQDSDAVQYDLHDFFSPPGELFMVGDRRQSIYGFRGARPDLITGRHPQAAVIDLRECFRCSDRIVEAANRLIAHNGDTLAQPMIGSTGRTGTVGVIHGRTADIVSHVADERRRGYPWGEIAVLARNHRTLSRLEFVMRERGIPCYRVGSRFDICTTEEFRDTLAVLRLIVNPRDDLAFLRLCNRFGVDHGRIVAWRARAAEDRISLCQAAMRGGEMDMPFMSEPAFGADMTIKVLIGMLRLFLGAPDAWHFWDGNCRDMTVKDAVAWYGLFNAKRDAQEDLPDTNAIHLLTVHAAKGLEWPCVYVVNLNEGDFPSSQSIREEGGVEEERRVVYVAATRSKERLVLHYRREADQSEEGKIKPPSRFLAEMGLTIREAVTA